MNIQEFHKELNTRIARHDLLTHPFYQAWAKGELTREDLCSYAMQYFHHVAAFPDYLEMFESRPQLDGELMQAVAENRAGEDGHAELWLDFAEGMGADRASVSSEAPPQRRWLPFMPMNRRCRGWPRRKPEGLRRCTALMPGLALTSRSIKRQMCIMPAYGTTNWKSRYTATLMARRRHCKPRKELPWRCGVPWTEWSGRDWLEVINWHCARARAAQARKIRVGDARDRQPDKIPIRILMAIAIPQPLVCKNANTAQCFQSRGPGFRAAILILALSALLGCGVPGAPLPPSAEIPKFIGDLKAQRKGAIVTLTWTTPTETSDGELIRKPGKMLVQRALSTGQGDLQFQN